MLSMQNLLVFGMEGRGEDGDPSEDDVLLPLLLLSFSAFPLLGQLPWAGRFPAYPKHSPGNHLSHQQWPGLGGPVLARPAVNLPKEAPCQNCRPQDASLVGARDKGLSSSGSSRTRSWRRSCRSHSESPQRGQDGVGCEMVRPLRTQKRGWAVSRAGRARVLQVGRVLSGALSSPRA